MGLDRYDSDDTTASKITEILCDRHHVFHIGSILQRKEAKKQRLP
jgi:hypothetical protein